MTALKGPAATHMTAVPHLTRRDIAVLRLTASGFTAKEIARELGISKRTAEHYRDRLRLKFGACRLTELAWHATALGLADHSNCPTIGPRGYS